MFKLANNWKIKPIQPSIAIYSFFDYQEKSTQEFHCIKKTNRIYHQYFDLTHINQQEIYKIEIFRIYQEQGKSKLKIKHLSSRYLYFI